MIFFFFIFEYFFANMSRKFKFHQNLTRITGTFYEGLFAFLILFRWILLKIINFWHRSCRQCQNTHFTFSNLFFSSENHAACELVCKNYGTAGQTTDGNILRRVCFAWWIFKATDTHWEYVMLLAFPRQHGYAKFRHCSVISTLLVLFLEQDLGTSEVLINVSVS